MGLGDGEMSEWFKEPVLKTGDSQEPWVRIPLSPPHFYKVCSFGTQKYPSGRRGSPAKGVGRETVARVQIPPSAPESHTNLDILSGTLRVSEGVAFLFF